MKKPEHIPTNGTFTRDIEIPKKYTVYAIPFHEPCECPLCHSRISPKILDDDIDCSGIIRNDLPFENYTCYIFFLCPACQRVFVGEYLIFEEKTKHGSPWESFLGLLTPRNHELIVFPENIRKISEKFCKIYDQSANAEEIGLDEITGPGYRKCLEFLIKDYLCDRFPEASEEIKKMELGKCINDMIDDRRLKVLASRSAWIGNDQTHYIQKHDSLTIEDMKKFIDAAVSFINHEIIADIAEGIQPKK